MADSTAKLRVGIDVGGTNTDGVVLDPSETNPASSIRAWHKTATTPDPSDGIDAALSHMFSSGGVDPSSVSSVTIGTTHFVNAVVEADSSRLSPVAVVRLCGPFSKHVTPCVDWSPRLRDIILGHYALLRGGIQVDGALISDIDEAEIRAECANIRAKGITSVVVNAIFSPIDTTERQEQRAADIIRSELPAGAEVVCSRDVANLGFIERENAAILNASILTFARKTIRSFQKPIKRLGLKCPLFIAQNDGTILDGEGASRLPIRTFSSGPTNSMRGAAFLVDKDVKEDVMVVDIGGTTTDVGMLQANGFPRQRAAYSELEGVRVNFPGPDIKSIGLGGGSIVRLGTPLTVGPDSVGHRLSADAVVFGGSTLTATDLTVLGDASLTDIGDRALLHGKVGDAELVGFRGLVKKKLEDIIDMMKTSPADIPVILVGGGAVVAPEALQGASRVMKPQWSQVANAVGAAMARVSAVYDSVLSTEEKAVTELLEVAKKEAIAKTIEAGAKADTVDVAEADTLPLPYVANMTRFIVRAVGDVDPTKIVDLPADSMDEVDDTETKARPATEKKHTAGDEEKNIDIDAYKPDVRNRVWYISETDVEWIATGCYILGTGGGGSPYSSTIRLRTQLRKGGIVRVVDAQDIADDAQVGCGGGAGSPTVAVERLAGDEILEAQRELYKMCDRQATHLIAIEIGGANGLQNMILGASTHMDLPVVDGDWMGRAYPTKWQTTPVVFNERDPIWSPIAMSDGSGNVIAMPRASSDRDVDRILRAALAQMGSLVGIAEAPVTGAETKRWAVQNTISQAWRIGRGVARVRAQRRTAQVAESIIDEFGGSSAGRVLWKGKIIGVERTVREGYAYGECLIQGADLVDEGDASAGKFRGVLRIPFKNENIAAMVDPAEGEHATPDRVLAMVPDLISVIDAQNGEAVGTPEYRYGLLVVVLGLAASDKWTGSERGIEIGGPKSFGFGHLDFTPLGRYQAPRSVIDEYNVEGSE